MRPTAAAANRALTATAAVASPAKVRPTSAGGEAQSFSEKGNHNEARAQMLRSVQLRSQLRQQRIRERVEMATTAEAAYLNPNEQWESYLAKCGKWSPGGRRPSPERLRLAHQTAGRIFSEAAAEAEQAVVAMVGPSEAAAAMAASAGVGPAAQRETRAPIVDSHGMWVGEKMEQAYDGAAGASSAALWRNKEEQKLETRRLDFLAKAAERNAASGYMPTGSDTPAAITNAASGSGIAGMSSKTLSKAQRERSGVFDETAKRAPTPPGGRPQLTDVGQVNDAVGPGGVPRRPVAGMTSTELYTLQHQSHARAVAKKAADEAAGVASADLYSLTTEMKLEAEPSALKHGRPDQRVDCEVKTALQEPASMGIADYVPAGGGESLAVVSNAPAHYFDGAAGMSSAEVRKARSDLGQKRHTNPLEGGGSKPVESVTAAAAAPLRPPPVPRLAIAPGTYSFGGSPEKPQLTVDVSDGPAPHVAATAPSPGFAGQKSSLISKPANAWEARHVWSENVPRGGSPRGGFGEKKMSHLLAGGAGLTSGALAQKAGELKFETPVSPMGPRIKKGAAAIAAAAAAGAGSVQSAGPELFNGAAGLTSSKICEIGPGHVNKFDAGSPAKMAAAAERKAERSFTYVGRVPGEPTGAAGLTSQQIVERTLSEATAEQKRMSMLAAHAAQRTGFTSPSAPRVNAPPQLSASGAFSGAAGVSSDQMGKEVVKREFFERGVDRSVPGSGEQLQRGQASPSLRRSFVANSSAGVAAAIFGGEAPSIAQHRNSLTRVADGHGLSSQQVAMNRLVSRQAHGQPAGGKRSASEPRRRPSSGAEAGSLIYGNEFARGLDLDIGASSKMSAEASMGSKVAGRTSSELAMPREERNLSRPGNARDNMRSFGGLGGYMTGGCEPDRRHSVGQPDWKAAAVVPLSPARNFAPQANFAPPTPAGKASTWITSSSAVGAGWSPGSHVAQAQARFAFQPSSPGTRGIRA